MGDVIHNLPVVADLRAHVPGIEIDWVVEEAFADVARMHVGLRNVLPMALRRWRRSLTNANTWREIKQFRSTLRGLNYDRVIDTQGLVKSAIVARCARGLRCGYAAKAAREPLAARCYDECYAIPKDLHAIDRNRRLVGAVMGYTTGDPPDYGLSAKPLTVPWLATDHYAVFITATSRDDKRWPDEHWQSLANALAEFDLTLILPWGSTVERQRAERLATGMRKAVVAPAMRLAALASLFVGARLVVGVDTGLTHLATAVGVPVVGLYSASDPKLTGVKRDRQAINLGDVGRQPAPAQVAETARRLLA